MKIIVFEDFLFDVLECFTSIKKYSLRHDDARTPSDLYHLCYMLKEEHLSSIGLKDKVLLNLFFFFSTKWRIRKNDIISIFILDVSDIRRKRIHFTDIWIMHSMKDHIHDTKDIGKRSFFIPEKCRTSKKFEFFIGLHLWTNMIECFDKKSTAARCRIIYRLSYFRIDDIDDEFDDRSWGIEFSTIASIISHPLEQVFIYLRELEEVILTLEVHSIDDIDNFTKCMPAINTIVKKIINFTNLIFH